MTQVFIFLTGLNDSDELSPCCALGHDKHSARRMRQKYKRKVRESESSAQADEVCMSGSVCVLTLNILSGDWRLKLKYTYKPTVGKTNTI